MTYKAPPHPLSAAFTARVNAALRERRWSCRQAAAACGTTGPSVWRVTRGVNPSLVTALLLARGLGISLDDLISDKGTG